MIELTNFLLADLGHVKLTCVGSKIMVRVHIVLFGW